MDKTVRLQIQNAIQNLPNALALEKVLSSSVQQEHLAQFEHLSYSTYDLQILSKTVAQVLTEHPELEEASLWPQWLSKFNDLYEYAAALRRLISDTFDQECTLFGPLTVEVFNEQGHIVKERTLSLPITLEWESVGMTSIATPSLDYHTNDSAKGKTALGIILTPYCFKSLIMQETQDRIDVKVLFNEDLLEANLKYMLSQTLFTANSSNFKIVLASLLEYLTTLLQLQFSQPRHGAMVNGALHSIETCINVLDMQTISKQHILGVLSTA